MGVTNSLDNAVIAVIGCGNMGSGLVRGFCREVVKDPSQVIACDSDSTKTLLLHEECFVRTSDSAAEAIEQASIVVLALKPSVIDNVLKQVRPSLDKLKSPPLIVSIAAGVRLERINALLGAGRCGARAMPNTPATIGKGMTAIYVENSKDSSMLEMLFSGIGRTVVLHSEDAIDCATGLSGSGPAFIFAAIEAMADGGVKMGLARNEAMLMAAQTVFGAAALVIESGMHPAELKDMVASPNGTTIAGLHVLEQRGFRGTLMSAVAASTTRAREE